MNQKIILERFPSCVGKGKHPLKPSKRKCLLCIHSATPKMGFPSCTYTQQPQKRLPNCTYISQDPKRISSHGKNGEISQNREGKHIGAPTVWEIKIDGWTIWWACLSKHLISQEVKNTFSQKWVASQFEFWLPYSSHPHALTNSTTFGWLGTKDKMGSSQFYGFSPLSQGSEYPPPIPCEIMPPYL